MLSPQDALNRYESTNTYFMESFIELTIEGIDEKTAIPFIAYLASEKYGFTCNSYTNDNEEVLFLVTITFSRKSAEDDLRIEFLHELIRTITTEIAPFMNENDIKKLLK